MERGSLTKRLYSLTSKSRQSNPEPLEWEKNEEPFTQLQSEDQTSRTLKDRHIQLIGFGGTIGTALFVQIGSTLTKGGPASLFLAFTIWSTFIMAINNCLSEMVSWIPISSPFVRYADHFVDPALGFCAGVNFFVFEAALIPFEIVAFNVVLKFWTDEIPLAAVICFVLVTYAFLNLFAVKYYGEAEFWLALGKVILAIGLICFTFITMVGGNPHRDAYGFRYWKPSNVPGAPFAEFIKEGSLGRFLGFLACLIQASFTIAGPDYVAMTAGEARKPRQVLPKAFNSVFYRLTTFFVLGSLSVGIVVPYNDPDLLNAISNAHPGAGASPYVIAMQHMGIKVLPHIVNALVLTAVYSAGNSYVYCASRTLYGLALEGKMPRFLTRCTGRGVPIYCVGITLAISAMAFLQLSNNAAVVLNWFVNLVTASQLLNYATVAFTYTRFYAALKRQGISRDSLPHKSFWQPYSAYYALAGTFTMAFVGGYTVFLPGNWNIPSFLFSYTMIGIYPILFMGWKMIHRTKWRSLEEIDFFESERADIDRYERDFTE
ncbi:general amino acid permease AGP2 [Macrolepiota fuliginosa MF-IS2]|uniref:General amino acid permease AGP2 n=1 Tax=Macrolepiota fuliginosa MF-IS2 TaxID=1400762 RepID=A0A9P6C3S8_9AGAR|nr:general amino acid permease AGP2 [Macrolepiota fuliginosa MF-IS2]